MAMNFSNILQNLQNEAEGLDFGSVTLTLNFRDSHLSHYEISRKKSYATPIKSVGGPCSTKNYGQTGEELNR
jgi:hypothetical protein